MKIIERKEPKIKSVKITCHSCKSKLEYENKDIQSDRNETYIICPVCKTFISI